MHGRICNSNNINNGGGEAIGGGRTTVQRRPRYKTGDSECGSFVCFADDGSESVSDRNLEELEISMEQQYAAAASFLTSSMLQVNGDKTHAMLLTTAQNRRLNNLDITVNFGNDLKRNYKVERLLGL